MAPPCPGDLFEQPPRVVSVLVAAYKAARWLRRSIGSVLGQALPGGWAMEILVGVDGCPETLEVAKTLVGGPVRAVEMEKNVGTYIVANTLLSLARGELFCRHDADDEMLPGRLKALVGVMSARPEIGRANTLGRHIDEAGKPIRSVPLDGVWMYRREPWDREIGGFEDWRCGADSEALDRCLALKWSAHEIKSPLYLRRRTSTSLTVAPETSLTSQLRAGYRAEIAQRRAAYAKGARPVRLDPVVAPYRPVEPC